MGRKNWTLFAFAGFCQDHDAVEQPVRPFIRGI